MNDVPEVLLETRDRIQWITINRMQRRNALNAAVFKGILHGLHLAQSNPDIRAIVLTGAGERAFCAGADLSSGTGTFGHDFSQPQQPLADLMRAARACRLPLVARVNGACLAGGMGLLGMCDMAVAADHAIFGLPEVKIGVFPMQVLSVLLPLVSRRALTELCLTGEPVDASAAQTMGLINHVVPGEQLDTQLEWLLSRIIDKSPTAIRRGKYALEAVEDMTFAQSIAFTESLIGPSSLTRDAAEGVAAFLEKRNPEWTGQ